MGQRGGEARPVRSAAGQECDVDCRPVQRHVGDFDPPGEQREVAQASRQLIGRNDRLDAAVVAEQDVVEAHRRVRKQRDRNAATERRVKARDRMDLRLDGVAHCRGRDEERKHHQGNEQGRDDGANRNRETLQAKSRGHWTRFRCCRANTCRASGKLDKSLTSVSDSWPALGPKPLGIVRKARKTTGFG